MAFISMNYRMRRLLIIALNLLTVIAIFGLIFHKFFERNTLDPRINERNDDGSNNSGIELDLKYQIDDLKKIKHSIGKEINELETKRNFLIKEIKKFEEIMEDNFAKIAQSKKKKLN